MSKRTPIEILRLTGSHNLKRALAYPPKEKKIANSQPARPLMPDTLSPEEKQIWKTTADLLEKRNVLTACDGDCLALYCQTFVAHRRELALLEKEGRIYRTSRINKSGLEIFVMDKNPRVGVVSDLEKRLLNLLKEFGMTPRRRFISDDPPEESKQTPAEKTLAELDAALGRTN